MFSQIKDIKHIEWDFHSVACVMPLKGVGLVGAGVVKNLSVGICNGAPSTAHSSLFLKSIFGGGHYEDKLKCLQGRCCS